jgi:hypothetical protein
MMRILTHPNVARAVTASALLAIAASAACPAAAANPNAPITKADVLQAETAWGNGIVQIGDVFTKGGDYKAAAAAFIAKHYAYKDGTVLFKPTKAAVDEFREDKDQALSYFVGGSEPEDHGFAITPWSKVRFDTKGIYIDKDKDSAVAMGNYYFTNAKTGQDVKVDFTMGFKRAPKDGHLELFLHHSSLPYEAEH